MCEINPLGNADALNSVVVFLDRTHLLAILAISRIFTPLGNTVINTICLICSM